MTDEHAKTAHEDLVTFTGEDGTSFKILFDPSRLMDDNAYEYSLFTERVSIVSIRLQAVTGNAILTELTEPVVTLPELRELPHLWRQCEAKPSGAASPDGTVMVLTIENFVLGSCKFGNSEQSSTIVVKLPTRFGRPVELKIEAADTKQVAELIRFLSHAPLTGVLPLQVLGFGDCVIYARPHFDAKIINPIEAGSKTHFDHLHGDRMSGITEVAA